MGSPVDFEGPVPDRPDARPFGTSFLPDLGLGVDLSEHGYQEHEYFVSGTANLYAYDAGLERQVHTAGVPYTTRVLVRRPADPGAFDGVVQVEPLHPAADNPNVWTQLWRHIVRNSQAWVGVTVVPANAALMVSLDPDRYGALALTDEGLGWDIVGQVVTALRSDSRFFGAPAERLYLSGRSYTGTFCRVFVMDGFHDDTRLADGRPAVDGYVIGISSGGLELGGYHRLSGASAPLPIDDPRRVVRCRDVPAIELLSENESETHGEVLRDDGDAADDRYRLYQVAGASHVSQPTRPDRPVNSYQASGGRGTAFPPMLEPASTFCMDHAAAAAYDNLDRWVARGVVPPRADRLVLGDKGGPGRRGNRPEARPLVRDEHGNALGGIRSTYVDVPVASYYPHSTPVADEPYESGPIRSAAMMGDLLGAMEPFDHDKLVNLYGTHGGYVERVSIRADELVDEGWLLAAGAETIKADAAAAIF